jgi:hypothetical protein
MKKNVFYTVMMMMAVLMTACSSNDDDLEPVQPALKKGESRTVAQAKTVLVYMAGRNCLSGMVNKDLNEMKLGSKRLDSNDNLLVFVRRDKTEKMPWLARIKNGVVTDSVSLSDMGITSSDGENRASDPVVMEGVMHYAFSHYPAMDGNYGLVLWGHGSGWLMDNEVKRVNSRAFGVDKGEDGRALWMNIPTMANILKGMPHLKFIMADCCNFMCLEVLYELRNVCDYVIGSPAEIPDQGAPYDEIVPDMFADGRFYTSIIDKYYKSVNGYLPLTAVQSSQMEQLAQATHQAMQAVQSNLNGDYADMTGLIHYYHTDDDSDFHPEYNIFYDAGDFFLAHAPQDAYQQWKQSLDQAVVERRNAALWNTDKVWFMKYSDFTVTDAKMHGVSMFVGQNPAKGNYAKYNEDIKKMAWWNAIN